MAVPYMARAMRGWVKNKTFKVITQTVVNHRTVETTTDVTMKVNFQSMPPAEVNRKPEEQRTWKWWSLVVVEGQELFTDDIFTLDGKNYRVKSKEDWSESGFRKYGVIEDYNRG